MATRRTEDGGSALAAVVWSRPPYVTLPARGGGLGNEPDPLRILVVRRRDGACASMALPPPIRAAFAGLERNVVLQHAPALQACVRSGLPCLVLRPGDHKTLAAVNAVAFRVAGGGAPSWLWFGRARDWRFAGNRATRLHPDDGEPVLVYELHLPSGVPPSTRTSGRQPA